MNTTHPLEIIYLKAKEAHLGLISNSEAAAFLVRTNNLNPSSANTTIRVFHKLVSGEEFTRTLSLLYFEYFLYRIHTDLGVAKLDLALKAITKHINYIKGKGDSKIRLRRLVADYAQKVLLNEIGQNEIEKQDEAEQEEIIQRLSNESRAEVIDQLNNIKQTDPELVVINGKKYKRDNKIIAQIKFLRECKCQICSKFIIKANGKKYIEAAHIVPKSLKGPEMPSNILLLCPNHHKEFDLGKREIILHDENQIHFMLNGDRYELNLKLE